MVLLGALGILISSVFSLPNLMQMLDSPRVSGGASYASTLAAASAFELGGGSYLLTLLMRTFSSDLLGNGIDYKGWGNYLEAPLSYCGLIALLLVPQLFGFLRTRQRIVYATFLGIFIFAEIFPWFRQGFWLFQGDYFRDFSLYTAIIFILFSVFAFDRLIKGQKVNYLILCVSIFTLIILLYFPYEIYLQSSLGNTNLFELAVNHNLQIKILLFLVLLATSLILFNNEKLGKYAALCILIITSIELASFNDDTINSIENSRESLASEELSQRVGYNDYSIEALTFIKKQERSFYRIEKNYGSSPVAQLSLNDSKAQHYFGSSSYHSFNQLNYINFLSACGVLDAKYEDQSRWSSGVRNAPLSQVLVGIKYLLIKDDGNLPLWLENLYSKVGKFRDVDVLKAKYSLPLGVAYDTYITQSDFSVLDESRKGIALLKAIMIPDALAKNLPTMAKITGDGISENTYGIDDIALDTDKLKASSLRMKSFTNNSIDGEITVSAKQLLFLSFPYDEGWSATLNGKAVEMIMVDGGLSAISIEPGNNVIALRYFPPFVKTGFFLTLLGFVIFLALIFWSRRLTSQGDSLKLASWLSGKA